MSLSKLAFLIAFIVFLVTALTDNFLDGKGLIWGLVAASFGWFLSGASYDRTLL